MTKPQLGLGFGRRGLSARRGRVGDNKAMDFGFKIGSDI